MNEQWRPVVGHPKYEVSNYGRVISYKRSKSKFLALHLNRDGYVLVPFCENGSLSKASVHSVVLRAFMGPPPPGHECHHKNDIKDDNRLENLEWLTKKQNIAHRIHRGACGVGSAHPKAKLTEDDVRAILSKYDKFERGGIKKLSVEYGVSFGIVSAIIHRRTWRHI